MKKKKLLNRRDFLRLASLSSAGFVLASCSVSTPTAEATKPQSAAATSTAVPPAQDVEVTVMIYGNLLTTIEPGSVVGLFTEHLMKYNEKGKGVTVKYEGYPGADEYNTKLRMITASGELEDTLVWANWQAVPGLVKDDILYPLDDLMKAAGVSADEWIKPVMADMSYDPKTQTPGTGSIWGLPYAPNAGADFNFINMDLVSDAGFDAPTDKSTLLDLEKIATAVAKPDQGIFGISTNLWGTTHGVGWDQAYVGPFGGDILDETGTKCVINSAECVEAYKWEYDLRHVKHIAATPDEVTAYGGYREGAMKSKLAMHRMGAWGGAWFIHREKNTEPEMAYALWPTSYDGRANGTRGNNMSEDYYGISANVKHPEACFGVLHWLTGREAGIYMLEAGTGQVIPRVDILNDPIIDKYPWEKTVAASISTAEVLQKSANLRDREINELIGQKFQTVDTGQTVPDQAFLDGLASEIQKILDMPKPS